VLRSGLMNDFLTPQFRRFLVAGGIAACVNIASRVLYDLLVSYSIAIVLAHLTGMATAYLLTRRYVFTESDRRHLEGSFRFAVVNLAGIAQTWLVSMFLATYVLPAMGVVNHGHDVAHIIGVGAPVFTSFVAHRYWTFR
jgi:putative flippase GtrA